MTSRFRFRFTAVTLLVLIALGALGYGIYELYVPRAESFQEAIWEGDRTDVARFLRRDIGLADRPFKYTPNSVMIGGRMPLEVAAMRGDLKMVRLLLAAGADPDRYLEYEDGTLAPIFSAYLHTEILRVLIDAGADINAVGYGGATTLHQAASQMPDMVYMGRPPNIAEDDPEMRITQIMLEAGVEVDARDDAGDTPLLLAALRGHPFLVALLLKHGADATVLVSADATVTVTTSRLEDPRLIAVGFRSIIHRLAMQDHLEPAVLRLLLKHGVDLESEATYEYKRTPVSLTPIGAATVFNHPQTARILRDAGARIDPARLPVEPDGDTLLHDAASHGQLESVKWLLDIGLDPLAKNKDGYTPLDYAKLIQSPDLPEYRAIVDLLRNASRLPD